ncbi:MAG: inositol monophosphatase family protein [Clostridia bacterium]|nr:inositol monophosphatase family protein [Clostridia bacterium]
MLTEQLEAIAREAGSFLTGRGTLEIESKEGHANFVTAVDKKVQAYLRQRLPELVPGSRFIGEEGETEALTDDPTWIVDPVDGTTNLIHDYRQSAVSIALTMKGETVIGLVYQPYTDEMFLAEKGKGAYLNGRRIRVSDNAMERALVAFGTSPYNPEKAGISLKTALRYLLTCADIRRTGSAAVDLCNVACGRTDVFFELELKPWDVAAGALLITEAGGVFRMPLRPDGLRFEGTNCVFASNAVCAEPALDLLMKEIGS